MPYPRAYNATTDMVDAHIAAGRGDKPAFVDPGETLSYAGLAERTNRVANLFRTYGIARLEAASRRGNTIGAISYGSIASILKHGLDKAFATEPAPDTPPIRHGNIRGSGYFH